MIVTVTVDGEQWRWIVAVVVRATDELECEAAFRLKVCGIVVKESQVRGNGASALGSLSAGYQSGACENDRGIAKVALQECKCRG